MNWLLKLSQQKPMLPVAPPTKDRERRQGINYIDEMMRNNTARMLKQKYPTINYEGAGSYGIAFESEPGEIIKVTDDKKEVDNAIRVFEGLNEGLDWVVPVLERPSQVQRSPDLWTIRMKKLKALPINEQRFVKGMFFSKFDEVLDIDSMMTMFVGTVDPQRMIELYNEMMSIYQKNNGWFKDLHGGNFGVDPDDGKIKLLDLGY